MKRPDSNWKKNLLPYVNSKDPDERGHASSLIWTLFIDIRADHHDRL